MRRFMVLFGVVLALGVGACSGSSTDGGGEVGSDAALYGLMGVIALDFAQVLSEVAPSYEDFALKENGMTSCPQGGTAMFTENSFGSGTLELTECVMKGITVSGTLGGFLESGPSSVDATMMSGPVTASGGYSAELMIQSFTMQAQLPVTDETTYWEVMASTMDGVGMCAWSGGPGCAPMF